MLVRKDGTARLVREGNYWHTAARPDGKVLVLDDAQGRYVQFHTGRTHETVALIDLKELPPASWTK